MHPVEPHLAVLRTSVRVPQVDPAFTERLHLAAHQHDPGLVGPQDVVVVPGTAVLGHRSPPLSELWRLPSHEAPKLAVLRASGRLAPWPGRRALPPRDRGPRGVSR